MLLTWLQATPGWVLPGASLDMNFAAGTYYPSGVDGLITVTRAQTVSSYATTSTGSLTAFAANTPRITDLGLLVEQAATNIETWSADFSNAAWSKTTFTVVHGTIVAPDGTTTADALTSTGSDASLGNIATASASTTYTGSVWAKVPSGTLGTKLQLANQGGTTLGSASNITLTTTWQRFQITQATGIGATGIQIRVGGFSTIGVGVVVHLWGAQIELGSFATSYIPTTTVAVARAADVITFNSVVPFANGFGAFIDVRAIPSFAATVYYLAAAAGNRIFYSSSNANLSTYNGTTVLSADPLSGDLSSGFRGAARYKTSDRAIAVNSGTVATDANTNGVPGTVYIGSLNGTGPQNTYTKRITIFQTLSNVQIGALAQ